MECPRCGEAGDVRLSHEEGFWERRVLRIFGWRPFRCRGCGERLYLRGSGSERVRKRSGRRQQERGEAYQPSQPTETFEEVVEALRRTEAERAEKAKQNAQSGPDKLRAFSKNG